MNKSVFFERDANGGAVSRCGIHRQAKFAAAPVLLGRGLILLPVFVLSRCAASFIFTCFVFVFLATQVMR